MLGMSRHVAFVIGALCFAIGIPDRRPATNPTSASLPTERGFYYAGQGKYRKLPGCRGDECNGCAPRAWLDAAERTPVEGHAPAFLLRSLVVPPQSAQREETGPNLLAVITVVTLRVDSPKAAAVESTVKVVDSKVPDGALSLSFTQDLTPGTYIVVQGIPDAARYGSVTSTTGSLCFLAFDAESKVIGPARPLGVFAVR